MEFLRRRREFITLLGSAAVAWKVWRIGVLETISPELNAANFDALRRALRNLGYIELQNLIIEYRSAEGQVDRFPELAIELVRAQVDVIVTRGTPATVAAKTATTTIPVVMAASGEPLTSGVIAGLARPGGNVTGLSAFTNELIPKRIELLNEAVSGLARIAFLQDMANPIAPSQWEELKAAALSLRIEPFLLDVRKSEDVTRAFEGARVQRVNALAVGNDTVTHANRRQVVELAAQQRLPVIYATREFVDAGGLMTYGVNYSDLYRRAATYVDKIFKGAKPADLPVDLKTARALDLTITRDFLLIADEVLE